MRMLKNLFKVLISNVATIISGLIVSFLLPKIISVSDYGFYKVFALYFNYLGVLSLGIIDGIVLKYGEKNYEELDRQKFRSYFALYFILHIVLTIIILMIAIFIKELDKKFIILMLGANLLPANLIGYFQQVSQITQRFKEYSIRRILQSISNILIVLLMIFLYYSNAEIVTYRLYLICLFFVNFILSGSYIVTYRDIIFGKKQKLIISLKEVVFLAKLGFPLLISNLCSTLLFSLDRQFVSILFSTEEYAKYAFAYSIVSLMTVATSAISIVIYPMFKRMDVVKLKENFHNINMIFLVLIFGIVLIYFPLKYFILWFLPQYNYSISILRIILPGLVISSCITVIMHNFYKVFEKSTDFLKKSIVALGISTVFNVIAFQIFRTKESISIASIFALAVWYLHSRMGLRKFICGSKKDIIYIVLMCSIFYVCTLLKSVVVSTIIYFVCYILISILCVGRDWITIKNICKTMKLTSK